MSFIHSARNKYVITIEQSMNIVEYFTQTYNSALLAGLDGASRPMETPEIATPPSLR